MSFTATFPIHPAKAHPYTRLRESVLVSLPDPARIIPAEQTPNLRVPFFTHHGKKYVLVRDLAKTWNFPSSYQVIARLTRRSGVSKSNLLQSSDEHLNGLLLQHKLVAQLDLNTTLFYIELGLLYQILPENDALLHNPTLQEGSGKVMSVRPAHDSTESDAITISDVFPNHGAVEQSLPLIHSTFLSLTPITKLHVYRHEGNYRKVYGQSLSAFEREILTQTNNYALQETVAAKGSESVDDGDIFSKPRKPLGRQKKFVGNVDPNQLDVAENVLPGCGYIPEFNVNSICKVPNYFVRNKEMMNAQQNAFHNPAKPHLKELSNKAKKQDMPKQLYLLLSSTDQEAFQFKYYYYKSYRGPGSGNYKDAALVNKINKIKRFAPEIAPRNNASTHISAGRVTKPVKPRGDSAIKGLVHEYFSNENVEIVCERQRRFVEDFENLEMLHNNGLFNLLVNSYRDVARDTWSTFYKFKGVDFEKLYNKRQLQRVREKKAEVRAKQTEAEARGEKYVIRSDELAELEKSDLGSRFLCPTEYPEIMRHLPSELRGDDGEPETSLSEPIRYTARFPDKAQPGLLTQLELIKLPNANALGWDNIRKYRRR